MNESIKNSDAEVVIILCDDDALDPDYLENLNEYYEKNKTILFY
jgi:glycosyltransferase involved in cell wall biosynthesis